MLHLVDARDGSAAAVVPLRPGLLRVCAHQDDGAAGAGMTGLRVLLVADLLRVTVLDQEQAETIMWDGRHFVIRVRQADTIGRQRFSCAHGIIHTYFIEAGSSLPTDGAVLDSWSPQEEDLCDQGAAELLLPQAAFVAACPPHPDMDDVLRLAEAFDASAEATAPRVVTLSILPAAMIVLESSLKPAELTLMARRKSQPALPGFPPEGPVAPRLRVQKSLGHMLPYIPRHKSIGDSTPLAGVLADGAAEYVGETGLVPGRFRVSARLLPIRRDGVLIDRVVALLFDADAEQQPWSMRQSG